MIKAVIALLLCSSLAAYEDPKPNFVGELGKSWSFPSDHLPVGAHIGDWRLASWNMLNTLYLIYIESNSQGLANSLIISANTPVSRGSTSTCREALTVNYVNEMIANRATPHSILCLQEVGSQVLQQLKTSVPAYMTVVTDHDGGLLNGNAEVIIFDSRRFKQLDLTVTYYHGDDNTIMDLTLLDEWKGIKYHVINTHTPGGPDGPLFLRELCLYLVDHYKSDTVALLAGDINQQHTAIDKALDAAADELKRRNHYRHIGIPYLTHIDTQRTAIAYDHVYIATKQKKVKSRGERSSKVLPFLPHYAALLEES